MEWTSLGTVSGTNKMALPDSFSELYVCAWALVGGVYYSSNAIIPKISINGTVAEIFYLSGGYMAGDSRNARVYIDGSCVWLACFNQDGSDYIASSTLTVAYR